MAGPRVRFAPAPSGFLHVGGAWLALFNWIFARGRDGTFVLRLEDTDPATAKPEMVDPLLDSLEWLGITHDEGPYRQSERGERYREVLDGLLADGHAYLVDGDQRVEGTAWREGLAVRLAVPRDRTVSVDDVVRGAVRWNLADVEDFVVWRSAGGPTFYLANAVDDLDTGITHVIRGEDLLSSTPRALLVRSLVDPAAEPMTFAHLPLLVDEQRKKLSKRRGDVAVDDYRRTGFLAEALVNYLATLGWGAPDGVEVRPLDEIVDLFRLEDVTSSPAFFDVKKLTAFNGEYVRALTVPEFVTAAERFLPPEWDRAPFEELASLVQERVATLAEVPGLVDFLYTDEVTVDESDWATVMTDDTAAAVLDDAADTYTACEWTAAVIHEQTRALGERHGLKLGKAQAPIRVAVTGRRVGPPLFEALEVLGRDSTLARVEAARKRLATEGSDGG